MFRVEGSLDPVNLGKNSIHKRVYKLKTVIYFNLEPLRLKADGGID